MSYQIKLETFEGPLDLLLHLIRKNDMDVRDIEIAKITDQYLAFLNAMRTLDVDLASEFIVMAATLIYIKSKMLLPNPEPEAEEEGIDPREALMQRLIEYQKYKAAAELLIKKPILNHDIFKAQVAMERIQHDFDPKEGLVEVGIYELALAFQELLVRRQKIVHHIEADEITIEEKMSEVTAYLRKSPDQTVDFRHLFSTDASRLHRVVTFMAILELTRMQLIKLYQADYSTDIYLKVVGDLSKGWNYAKRELTVDC